MKSGKCTRDKCTYSHTGQVMSVKVKIEKLEKEKAELIAAAHKDD